MDDYINIDFQLKDGSMDMTPCPIRNSKALEIMGVELNNTFQVVNGTVLLPTEFLCPLDYQTGVFKITSNTYSIHHYNASWLSPLKKYKKIISRVIIKLFGKYFFAQLKKLKDNLFTDR